MREHFGFGSKGVSFLALGFSFLPACSSDTNGAQPGAPLENVGSVSEAISAGDDLTEAFATFQAQLTAAHLDKPFKIGFGPHPALMTETLKGATGFPAKGQASLDFDTNQVTATLDDVPAAGNFDLYFVKNNEGSGRTARPETGDTFLKVGSFVASTNPNDPPGRRVLSAVLSSTNMKFDLDLVVVTRAGSTPATSRLALGARTLMEKRLYRARFGQTAPSVTGDCVAGDTSVRCKLSDEVESLDPLVRRGAQLFFKETFGGNGRACGTCHRAENNLTIDPQFISTLPAGDPLFVAEQNSALSALEDSAMLRQQGLIRENTDGLDRTAVLRSVPHTFAMQTLVGLNNAGGSFPSSPPDNLTGWGGDGAPGRGSIAEFAFGAIVQHATKDLRRRPGTDFRIPTQAELDALEAFQLFTGRQKFVDATKLTLRDALAQRGRGLFLSFDTGGKCVRCHTDMGTITPVGTTEPPVISNFNFNTNVQALTPNLPSDDGFLNPRSEPTAFVGNGDFNVPVLIEAADTGPFFHNNVFLSGIEGAVSFYTTPAFQSSPLGPLLNIQLTQADVNDIGAFLRGVNAAENIRQIRKRMIHVRDVRAAGNSAILRVAIADCQDALDDLLQRKAGDGAAVVTLNPNAVQALQTVKQSLETALANPDTNRPSFMSNALIWLDIAKQDLFSDNPNNDF